MCNLSRVFKTDISAVLTVMSGLDPHRLEFSKKMAHDDNGDDMMMTVVMMVIMAVTTMVDTQLFIYL